MWVFTYVLLVFAIAVDAGRQTCPNGGQIYERGISPDGKVAVVNAHNKLRKNIAKGVVKGQPRGVDLRKLSYDQVLGTKAQLVSDSCELKSIIPKDGRFFVGQNVIKGCASSNSFSQDWQEVVDAWFHENNVFKYPNISNGHTRDYVTMVWAMSTKIGCDFIHFYDKTNHKEPYCKMYTCNYGPGPGPGQGDMAPYKVGCDNLC